MIGFAIATILLAAFERQQATKTIVYSTEKHHTALAHVLSTQLFPKYGNFLYSIQALDTQTLIESASMRQISEDIASQIVGSSIVKVKVYDINGRTTLSTDTSQIGRDKSLLSGFLAAKSGQVESQLGHRDTFQAIEETLVDRHLLSTYTPIYDNDDPNKIIGVFDVYTDVTPLMLRIKSTQLNIILGSLLILTVLQTVLYLFVHNADRLLTQQYEQVKTSEELHRKKTEKLKSVLAELKQTQSQVIHNEKMSSLGQLVAGIAHEINNPANFIQGNLTHAETYTYDLLHLIKLYEAHCPQPTVEIRSALEDADIDFIKKDTEILYNSLNIGAKRIQNIVLSLRNFSRLDESECKTVDIHEGLESALMILQHRLNFQNDRPTIHVVRDFDNLPLVECYPSQLNQVFMSLLVNAIDALDNAFSGLKKENKAPQITIRTETRGNSVGVSITDNGIGIPPGSKNRVFDPFFTTKDVGKGTGMGLAVSYQTIVKMHGGKLECFSAEGRGAEFMIELPIKLTQKENLSLAITDNLAK
ncbi:MAG: sensor histidine kinase [Phormidesmis sp.]